MWYKDGLKLQAGPTHWDRGACREQGQKVTLIYHHLCHLFKRRQILFLFLENQGKQRKDPCCCTKHSRYTTASFSGLSYKMSREGCYHKLVFTPSKKQPAFPVGCGSLSFHIKAARKRLLQLKSSCFAINLEVIIYPSSVALPEASCCGSDKEPGTVERTGTLCWKTKQCKCRRPWEFIMGHGMLCTQGKRKKNKTKNILKGWEQHRKRSRSGWNKPMLMWQTTRLWDTT